MTKKTQRDFVLKEIREKGFISRNYCLANFITRLGALIFDLKEEGWVFTTEWVQNTKPDGSRGRDFVYTVAGRPKVRKTEIFTDANGERKAREIWV